ncbi:ABC transporter permease [Flexivirga oryzae]|uniref:ABC3 transporter permease C-terminal domain-containing protein n=1 Tax=Flexivirga oryzae TaxID=1794944 RepID=A0A839NCC1_9MICO|nr:FtsX-like permease family protein [Flexivirga oryzae]MBB2892835.1 hypothetical protein [Flexivirga oryzae]
MNRLATIARRHRIGHAVLFAVAVCLLVATAAVDPLLTRSFSHAVVSFHADAEGVAGSQVVISTRSAARTGGHEPTSVNQAGKLLDPRVRQVVGDPVVSHTGVSFWRQGDVPVTMRSTAGQCHHLAVLQGHCPAKAGEVLVSRQTARKAVKGLHLGSVISLGGDPKHIQQVRVAGIYTMSVRDSFWRGTDIAHFDADSSASGATLLATTATVRRTTSMSVSLSYPVRSTALTPDSLKAAAAGARAMEKSGRAYITEHLNSVYWATAEDVYQVGRILPFLLVQLGVVLLILLVQVTSFFATVRRGEAAVLKMRGNGTAGVVRLGALEFLPPGVIGVVGGLALAYGVDELVRRAWLPGNVAASWNWESAWAAVGTALFIAALWLVCWWRMAREPIGALTRARPPRRRGARLSLPAAVVAAACLLGVGLTATKSLKGGPVQVTPVLLAGFVAILVGALWAPVTGRLVRRLLRGRRPAGALAVAQLGRRAGVVTAVTTLIITSALLTLSVSVFARGADNRAARTAADLGAPALVHVTLGPKWVKPGALIRAVRSADPTRREFTPAVKIAAATSDSNATLGVVPADMERIGLRTGLTDPVPWSAIGSGGWVSVPNALVSSWTTKSAVGSSVPAPTMADMDGQFRVAGAAPYIPGAGANTIVVDLPTMLRAGDRTDDVSFEVFSVTRDPHRLAALRQALERVGFKGIDVRTVQQVRAGYDATATAWAMNLSIVVSVLAVLAALTSVVLVAVASRADRRRDLRTLQTGGVSHRVVRSATVREFVLLGVLGSLVGALTAPVAAWLTGPTMLWWSNPPAQAVTRTGFEWRSGVLSAVGLIVLLALVGVGFGVRQARSTELRQGRMDTTA